MNELLRKAIYEPQAQVVLQVTGNDLREFAREMYGCFRADEEKLAASMKEKATLTTAEVCKILNVGTTTLNRWQKNGYLLPVKIGVKVLYRRCDIDRLLTEPDRAKVIEANLKMNGK